MSADPSLVREARNIPFMKFDEAAEKFKESYRLSRNPVLLYNIGFTFDQLGKKDLAVIYYKKFLTDAPADAVTASGSGLDPNISVAYAELHFSDVLWPDFDAAAMRAALDDFAGRERRFGKTSAQVRREAQS